jgi:hypothetical protein
MITWNHCWLSIRASEESLSWCAPAARTINKKSPIEKSVGLFLFYKVTDEL